MSLHQDPGDPDPHDPYIPPSREDDERRSPFERPPFERPPFERDPEAQRAPGSSESEVDNPQPPMSGGWPNRGLMGPPREPMGQGERG